MNIVILSGFIGNLSYRKINDFTVLELSLPYNVNVGKRDDNEEQETYWFKCKAYNKNADFINDYFNKGDGIIIQGHLVEEKWESKEGENRSRVVIVIDRVNFPLQLFQETKQKDSSTGVMKPKKSNEPSSDNSSIAPNGADDLPF